MDVMELKALWSRIFNDEELYTLYRPKNYALVCIDIYSRYVWAVAMDREKGDSIALAILQIFGHMQRPKILQGDEKIIKAFKKYLSPYILGITLVMTKPYETNKNAIVERAIKTLKNDLLKYLYVHPFPTIVEYLPMEKEEYLYLDTTSMVLQKVCNLRNHTFHRTIQQKPVDVFYHHAVNRQIIVKKKYQQYKQGDLVFVKPLRQRGDIPRKIFDFDYDIHVIMVKDGDKYMINSLYNVIHKIDPDMTRWYKPYELRVISPQQALEHLEFPLVRQYISLRYQDKPGLEKVKKYLQSLL
jgi:hypothetical protein